MYKICAFKGIGDLHATHSITVCTIKDKCIYKIVAFKVRMQLGCVDTANGFGICKKLCCFYHKKPSRFQCVFEAAISTVYLLRTCGNALAYWLKPFTH